MVSEEIKVQRAKFKDLSGRQKLQYIWDYYKFPIIIAAVIIYATATFVHGRLTAKTTVLNVAMINSNLSSLAENTLLEGFSETLDDYDPEHEQLSIDAGFNIAGTDQISYANMQRLLGEYAIGSIDATIAPKDTIEQLAESQAFGDLTELLPSDLLQTIKNQGIEVLNTTYEDPATGEIHEYPVAVNITYSPLIQQGFTEVTGDNLPYYNEPCYYAVSPNTDYKEHCIAFLKYLLN